MGAPADGEVGGGDVDAVAAFQGRTDGLKVDGKVGKHTTRAVHAAAPAKVEASAQKSEEQQPGAGAAAAAVPPGKAVEAEDKAAPEARGKAEEDPDGEAAAADVMTASVVKAKGEPTLEEYKGIKRTKLVSNKKFSKGKTHDDNGKLTQQGVIAASKAMRAATPRWEPTWLMAVQDKLGVSTAGGFSEAFIRAIADDQRLRGVKLPDGRLDTHGTTEALSKRFGLDPAKAWMDTSEVPLPDKGDRKGKGKGKKRKPKTAAEMAVIKAGYAGNWKEWTGALLTRDFLGQPIKGRPELHKRLMAAEAYLVAKEPGLDAKALGKKMGAAGTRSDYRRPRKHSSSMHSFGVAFDLGIADNPWILGQDPNKDKPEDMRAQANRDTKRVIAHATLFLGYGEKLSVASLARMGSQTTTDELADRLGSTSDALERYRAMAGDDAAIAAQYERGSAKVKKRSLAWWKKTIAKDDKRLKGRGTRTNWDRKGTKNEGFMTYRKELIVALRDIAGLAWGGCDLGNDSGDMMHWDMRSTDFGGRLHDLVHSCRGSKNL